MHINYLPRTLSDHHLILLSCMHDNEVRGGSLPFFLLDAWFSHQALSSLSMDIERVVEEIFCPLWRLLRELRNNGMLRFLGIFLAEKNAWLD